MLILLGIALAIVGLLVSVGGFGWFGRLPGDIRIERETTRIYIPLASMILISIVLNLILYLFRRFF
ncbi:MAG TPA: DUF2905 domain-containing protein [Gemmatimonadales bacterium]|nr:DUF2905 domain-containing protein [Gemmatimonadales bacterium]